VTPDATWDFGKKRSIGWLALYCPVYKLDVDAFSFYGTRAVT